MKNSLDSSSQPPSPMMQQWHACKQKAQDALLLFRMGDFYEAFYEDAKLLAKELELTLTSRQEIPMSGVPHHTCESYIDKLIAKGYRVAIAEQIEDPKQAKGLVKREVVRIVTPGTIINSQLLSASSNNFFAAITRTEGLFGLAFLDLTTAELWVSEFSSAQDLLNELYRLQPSELLISKKLAANFSDLLKSLHQNSSFLTSLADNWKFEHRVAYDFLTKLFQVHHLDGFGVGQMPAAISATGALLSHLKEELCLSLSHLHEIRPYTTSHYMALDYTAQRNLELTHSLKNNSKKQTLLDLLDHTLTPMGGRLMQHWVKQPLLAVEEIKQRQDGVQSLISQQTLLKNCCACFCEIKDLERLMMKISSGYATPKDLTTLGHSFAPIKKLKALLISSPSSWIQKATSQLDEMTEMTKLILQTLVEEPPLKLGEGKLFRSGIHQELDELQEMSLDSKSWIARYQALLREETGIKNLKVGFNKMFGYFIEVSRGQSDKMPDTFIRRQTLVNAERFITPKLKEYESKVLTAEERIKAIETELFSELKIALIKFTKEVLVIAKAVAKLDCLVSLATVAVRHHYCRPEVNEGYAIEIKEGRHPVIESVCNQENFICNDTLLNDVDHKLLMITGPNMAGKSTYLRQVALIVIMAQIGSFVPAKSALIGIVDKVYTRIGASDDLSRGHSTFMVEMTETANILNNATARSLIILDEIGRGTSTYDGISIAWAVAEFLLTNQQHMAKTLFATHYWELTKLEEKIKGAVNYHVAVHEADGEITFLRKVIKGGTDKSYGIHVAKLAGLPSTVIHRANEILCSLEEKPSQVGQVIVKKIAKKEELSSKSTESNFQLSLFDLKLKQK